MLAAGVRGVRGVRRVVARGPDERCPGVSRLSSDGFTPVRSAGRLTNAEERKGTYGPSYVFASPPDTCLSTLDKPSRRGRVTRGVERGGPARWNS